MRGRIADNVDHSSGRKKTRTFIERVSVRDRFGTKNISTTVKMLDFVNANSLGNHSAQDQHGLSDETA